MKKNKGKGYVMASMFRKVEADIYILVDGDDTYPAESVHELLKPVIDKKADMSMGVRLNQPESGSFKPLNLFWKPPCFGTRQLSFQEQVE